MLSLYASSFHLFFSIVLLLSHQQFKHLIMLTEKGRAIESYINTQEAEKLEEQRNPDPAPLPSCSLACMCCFSCSDASPLPSEEKSKGEEQRCGITMEVEAEASYSYGFLPPGRHNQPYAPPPPHPPDEGELWEYFPCPFCYIEVEMPFIHNHLQEEHCFDTRNAVCPICAENLGKDMSAHFRFQHSHLLKRRKPSKPSSLPWPAAPGKEPCDEANPYMMSIRPPRQDPEPDPLLSQFICSGGGDQTVPEYHDGANRHTSVRSALISDVQRSSQPVSQVELEERLQRIEFLSEIITSTIL